MAQFYHTKNSFNGGLVSRLVAERPDLEKVAAGCTQLRDWIPLSQGPLVRRAGIEYLGETASNFVRLIPFNFSASTTFVLEIYAIGDGTGGGMRVWSNGYLVPLEAAVLLPYELPDLDEVQFLQLNDVVYLTHPNHPVKRIQRLTDTRWTVVDEWSDLVGVPLTLVSGQPNVALLEEWDWTPDAEIMFEEDEILELIKRPPRRAVEVSSTILPTLPASPLKKHVRRLTFIFKASVTGSHTFRSNGDDWARCEYNDAISKGAGSVDFTFNMVIGEEVTITLIQRNKAGASSGYVQASWPGRAMAGLPLANIRRHDVLTTHGQKTQGNAYPPLLDENWTETTLEVSNTVGVDLAAVASADLFVAGHVGAFFQITHRRDLTWTEYVGAVGAFAGNSTAFRAIGHVDFFSYGIWSGNVYWEQRRVGTAAWEVLRSWKGNNDKNIVATEVFDSEMEIRIRVVGGNGTAAASAAVPRFLLESADGRSDGLIYVKSVTDARNAVVDVVRDLASVIATRFWTVSAFCKANGFPRSVSAHEQRLWFGGTRANPARLWGSVLFDMANFRRSTDAVGGMSFELAAKQSFTIQWMESLHDSIMIGTSAEEWTLGRVSEAQSLTPTSFHAMRRSSFGSDYVQPVMLGESVCYVGAGGKKLRRVTYVEDKYSNADLSALLPEAGRWGVTQLAAMHVPMSILWVRTGGNVMGLSLDLEQNVFAWHEHNFGGSIACVYGGQDADSMHLYVAHGEFERVGRLTLANLPTVDVSYDAQSLQVGYDGFAYADWYKVIDKEAGASLDVTMPYDSFTVFGPDGLPMEVVVDGDFTLAAGLSGRFVAGVPIEATGIPTRLLASVQKGSGRSFNHVVSRVMPTFFGGGRLTIDGELAAHEEYVILPAGHRRLRMPTFRAEGDALPVTLTSLTFAVDSYEQ